MALTNDVFPYWRQGLPKRSVRATQLKAATRIFKTAVGLQVEGVAQNMVSGAAMAALALNIAGVDANGGVLLSSRQPNVSVVLQAGALGVTVEFGADLTTITVSDAGTATAKQLVDTIRGHGAANEILRAAFSGTGASVSGTQALTHVPWITPLGAADRQYDNSAGVGILSPDAPDMTFSVGTLGMLALASDPPLLGFSGLVDLVDENTVQATLSSLDIQAPCFGIEASRVYVDLTGAR